MKVKKNKANEFLRVKPDARLQIRAQSTITKT